MALKESFRKQIVYIIILFILLVFLRLPYISIPFFNIDEAIYAAAANSILHGGVMYKDAADPGAPITPYFYAFIFKLFGSNNMLAVHMSLIFLALSISITLFSISVLIKDTKTGYLAALFFIIFSFTYYPQEVLAFNTEWLAAFFSSLGAYFLLKYILKNKHYFLLFSGIFFGLGFFSKQVILFHFLSAVLFCSLFIHIHIYKKDINKLIKSITLMATGFALVALFFILYFHLNNASEDFLFWFWNYHNKFYIPAISIIDRIKSAFQYLLMPDSFMRINYFLSISFVGGSIITIVNYFRNKKELSGGLLSDLYFIIWGFFAYMGASYSGRNFGHYFILILPPFCIVAGRAISALFNLLRYLFEREEIKKKISPLTKSIIRISLVLMISISILSPFSKYFKYNLSLRLWKVLLAKKNPVLSWPPLWRLSVFIRDNSHEYDKIFVWGFCPEIYALSNRLPASRYHNCNFLTGLVPWTNIAPQIDTSDTIVPGSWEIFIDEINSNLPLYIIDTSFGNFRFYAKYPPSKFKKLADIFNEHYVIEKDFFSEEGVPAFRLYKRKVR